MNENLTDGQAQIWWWNGTSYDAWAYWYTDLYKDEEGIETLGYAGWGDEIYWMPTTKKFAPGESFWIQVNGTVASADANFVMAGQVESISEVEEYYTAPLTPGVQVQMANPFPTGTLDIQVIKMSDNLTDGQAQIWWWNGASYDPWAYWYTDLYKDEEGIETLGYAGWGDEVYWMPTVKVFNPGEGFWIQVNGTVAQKDAMVKFPNPFYKGEN